eukprot:493350_1
MQLRRLTRLNSLKYVNRHSRFITSLFGSTNWLSRFPYTQKIQYNDVINAFSSTEQKVKELHETGYFGMGCIRLFNSFYESLPSEFGSDNTEKYIMLKCILKILHECGVIKKYDIGYEWTLKGIKINPNILEFNAYFVRFAKMLAFYKKIQYEPQSLLNVFLLIEQHMIKGDCKEDEETAVFNDEFRDDRCMVNDEFFAETYLGIGECYLALYEDNKAYDYYLKALKYCSHNSHGEIKVYFQLTNLLIMMNNGVTKQCLEYMEYISNQNDINCIHMNTKEWPLSSEQKYWKSTLLNNLAEYYQLNNKYDEALSLWIRCNKIWDDIKDKRIKIGKISQTHCYLILNQMEKYFEMEKVLESELKEDLEYNNMSISEFIIEYNKGNACLKTKTHAFDSIFEEKKIL